MIRHAPPTPERDPSETRQSDIAAHTQMTSTNARPKLVLTSGAGVVGGVGLIKPYYFPKRSLESRHNRNALLT
jgi:hypothetical protein